MNYSNNSSSQSSSCSGTKYVIKKGDTLYSISRRYNVPLALVLRANPYVDVYNLQIGDEICIPGEQESSGPSMRPPVITGPAPIMPPPVMEEPSPAPTMRPPVMMEPGPVIPPNNNVGSAANTYNSSQTEQRQMTQPMATQPVTSVPMPAMPRTSVGRTAQTPNGTVTTPSYSEVNQSSATTRPLERRSLAGDLASRNVLNINYYGSGANKENDYSQRSMDSSSNTNMGNAAPDSVSRMRPSNVTPRQTMATTAPRAPMVSKQPERQPAKVIMPVSEKMPPTMPTRQTIQMRQPMQRPQPQAIMPMDDNDADDSIGFVMVRPEQTAQRQQIVKRKRMRVPVRIIGQPVDMDESVMMPDEDDRKKICGWNCYQDRERFNTIMYNADQMHSSGNATGCCGNSDCGNMNSGCCNQGCCNGRESSSCTQNIVEPMRYSSEQLPVIAYVTRDDDSLQDIMDYFTIGMDDLFQFNVPHSIKIKPGCMINVPNNCDEY